MDKAAQPNEKTEILKKIEDIGNRDFDGVDGVPLLRHYLQADDAEIILSALQASGNYIADEELFRQIFQMAQGHEEEEVRAMACGCLGAVMQDGCEYEENFPLERPEGEPATTREQYEATRAFLFERVDAPMETMEVRRRALEALGAIGFLPEVKKIILRFYHQAPNVFVKVSALYAMGLVRDPVFEHLVLEELHNKNENILVEAVHAATTLELHSAEKRLLELLGAENLDLRYEVIVGLGAVSPLDRLPELLDRLEKTETHADMKEALEHARETFRRRAAHKEGEPLWDDNQVLKEIDEMVEPDEED